MGSLKIGVALWSLSAGETEAAQRLRLLYVAVDQPSSDQHLFFGVRHQLRRWFASATTSVNAPRRPQNIITQITS
jgi:hypothetical protein